LGLHTYHQQFTIAMQAEMLAAMAAKVVMAAAAMVMQVAWWDMGQVVFPIATQM